MILISKVIALALIWIGGIVSICVAVGAVLSLVASAVSVVATVVVGCALAIVAFLGIATTSASKL